MVQTSMNSKKIEALNKNVVNRAKGGPRRKRKIVHHTQPDDKKLQSSLKKLATNTIPGIEEVNMFKDDGTVIHFTNPKVQASLSANTFAVTGHAETKQLTEILPSVLNQMGPDSLSAFSHLQQRLAGKYPGVGNVSSSASSAGGKIDDATAAAAADLDDDDDVPELEQNFDEASKGEDVN